MITSRKWANFLKGKTPTQEETENLNSPIAIEESHTHKRPGPCASTGEFYQACTEAVT